MSRWRFRWRRSSRRAPTRERSCQRESSRVYPFAGVRNTNRRPLRPSGRREVPPDRVHGDAWVEKSRTGMTKVAGKKIALLLSACVLLAQSRGITHITRSEPAPRSVTIHVVTIDLSTPGLRFKLTPSGGTRETLRQTTLSFLSQEHAQVAINAHFFLPFPSTDLNADLIGLAASEGKVYSKCEQPVQSYALVANAPAINFDQANHATIVH